MALVPVRIATPDYSQDGEACIVLSLLGKMHDAGVALDRTCVEFGAGDGITLSNTRHLSECFGYSATLIEADHERFEQARKNAIEGTRLIEGMVSWEGDTRLDAIGLPPETDFMSIDIDGYDLQVFDAMHDCRPKVVCIEMNPTIPNDVEHVQPIGGAPTGSSARALVVVASGKGYQLAAATTYNLFFVRSDLFELIGITDNRLDTIRPAAPLVTHLWSGYDGAVYLSGKKMIPWSEVGIKARQVTPRLFRAYDLPAWKQVLFRAWKGATQ